MSSAGVEVWPAAAGAALTADLVCHPIDTLITRIQSPTYTSQYRTPAGAVRASLFRGLYQGFGPTLITGVPSSAAFWAVYERLKSQFEGDERLPQPLVHAASSAVGEVVACAIQSPAEVLKQNAQVRRSDENGTSSGVRKPGAHTLTVLKGFAKSPAKLWTGYPVMVLSHLPSTCITMSLYEYIKENMMKNLRETDPQAAKGITAQVQIAALSAGAAAGATSGLLVPIDVIKTRMRLAAGGSTTPAAAATVSATTAADAMFYANEPAVAKVWQTPRHISFLSIARETLRVEGLRGLFRGALLTCATATIGGGLYLGCYEGGKLYFRDLFPGQRHETSTLDL